MRMRHTSCSVAPARALRQIRQFTSSSPATAAAPLPLLHHDRSKRRAVLAPTTTTTTPIFTTSSLLPALPTGARSLTTTAPLQKVYGGGGGGKRGKHGSKGGKSSSAAVVKNRHPINDQIPFMWVRIVNPEDNSLSEPMLTSDVLERLDHSTVMLEMKAPPPMLQAESVAVELDPETGEPKANPESPSSPESPEEQQPKLDGPPAAICRIVDKAAAAAALAEAKRVARLKAVNTKELELNWTIGSHDLNHKLKRLREFLDKGMTVEVMLARKKRSGPQASVETATATLEAVRAAAAEIMGTRETKKMDGEIGNVVRLFFEGPSESRKRKLQEEKVRLEKEQEEVERARAEKGVDADHDLPTTITVTDGQNGT